jgi:hypothetical protein
VSCPPCWSSCRPGENGTPAAHRLIIPDTTGQTPKCARGAFGRRGAAFWNRGRECPVGLALASLEPHTGSPRGGRHRARWAHHWYQPGAAHPVCVSAQRCAEPPSVADSTWTGDGINIEPTRQPYRERRTSR